jgi:hypothetical protein
MIAIPQAIAEAAQRGWRLHPLRSRDKLPCLKEWQRRASSDPAQLEAWAREYPGCNWGAVCGPESGFFAVDVDEPDAMQRLEDEHGAVPEGLCNVTSRGYQLLYAWPADADVRPGTNCPAEGIDVRGRDSYIVIPPSVHPSGHEYHYSDDSLPIPACPPWLLALILARVPAGAQEGQSTAGRGAVTAEAIGKGGRTNRLVSLAGSMHRRGMTADAIAAALLAENAAKCNPPLPDAKVRCIARDISSRYPAGQSEAAPAPILQPDLVRLADVTARPVGWLWEPFLPTGMLTMLSGDPGTGKSFIALSIAADLTRGKLQDGRVVEPANVLYLSVENPLAQSIRPRFDMLGGDAERFFALRGTMFAENGEEQHGAVTLGDVPILNSAIQQTGAKLVIVDPLQSYMGANVDLHRSNETRPVLDGLSKLAEAHGCALLLLRHLSKQSGGKAIHRGLGSIDLTGAVRSEMLAGSLPDDPEARALVHVKSNVGRIGRTLGYAIDGEGRFTWTGECNISAADLLAAPAGPGDHKLTEATAWLTELLKPGPREQREVRELAEQAGISYATLRRAKNALRVRSYKASVRGAWMWALPDPAQDAQEESQDAHTKKMSTLANLSTLQDAQQPPRCSTDVSLSPLDSQGAQKNCVSTCMSTLAFDDSVCGGMLQ